MILERVYRQSEKYFKDLFGFVHRRDNKWRTYSAVIFSGALVGIESLKAPEISTLSAKFTLEEMEIMDLVHMGVLSEDRDGQFKLFSPLFAWWICRNAPVLLSEDKALSSRVLEYVGANDLKTLLVNIKSAQAVATGISGLL